MKDIWATKQEAAQLVGVAPFKIKRLVRMGLVEQRRDRLDSRRHLVNVTELRALLKDVVVA